jgi:hypothetical protein
MPTYWYIELSKWDGFVNSQVIHNWFLKSKARSAWTAQNTGPSASVSTFPAPKSVLPSSYHKSKYPKPDPGCSHYAVRSALCAMPSSGFRVSCSKISAPSSYHKSKYPKPDPGSLSDKQRYCSIGQYWGIKSIRPFLKNILPINLLT